MEILNLEGTEDTPKILLDKSNGIFEISERSLPEDSAEFYQPIIQWLDDYAADPNPSTEFVFKLEYFNTASSKLILDNNSFAFILTSFKIILIIELIKYIATIALNRLYFNYF